MVLKHFYRSYSILLFYMGMIPIFIDQQESGFSLFSTYARKSTAFTSNNIRDYL